MRVVHVAPTVFGVGGVFGGGERYPAELARGVADSVDCELVTFGDRRESAVESNRLRVTVLPTRGRLGRHPAHPLNPAFLSRLRGADLVHAHQLWALPTRLAGAARRAWGGPFVVTDHGLITKLPSRRLFAAVDRFLTVSQYSAEVLGAPPEKTTVVYGGVHSDRFRPEVEVERAGVLYVGRVTPHKGIDVLIRALPKGATLTVAGTTGHDLDLPDRAYPQLLHRLAQGRDVKFVGEVPDSLLPELHRRAEVMVLPSLRRTVYGRVVPISELLGLTLLEAMASGTPVVASRLGGVPEVVVDGVTGFLVEPGDQDALHERLALLLSDPDLARRFGDQARERVLERFTWQACARRCVDAYRELV